MYYIIAEYYAKILHKTQPSKMNFELYANDLANKSYKVADVFDEKNMNEFLLRAVDASLQQSIRHYCEQ